MGVRQNRSHTQKHQHSKEHAQLLDSAMARQPCRSTAVLPGLEHVFVYGTLKRGQCRQDCWPKVPRLVRGAWTLGQLVDLGPYPALLEGEDRVWGELWSFDSCDITDVHNALDRVEVTNQPGIPNEYDRIKVLVTLGEDEGDTVIASTYRFSNHQDAAKAKLLQPSEIINGYRYVVWPIRPVASDCHKIS